MPAKRKELKIEGANLWYLVGLITSDGCLSGDGRHIDITSKDYEFLSRLKDTLGFTNKIGTKNNDRVNQAYYLQFSNKNFYEFLVSIGLTPNKSLSLSSLNIAKELFGDFFRGLIDGDGSIRRWVHPSNNNEQWSLRIYSGSEKFINWLNIAAEQLLKVRGKVHKNANNTWVLKYGKMAAKQIAEQCYYKDCFGLDRKIKLAQECIHSYAGWSKSKTISPFCS
ncbi:MAG: LAGLIDADG family homing endonuclease [Candidatus Omnitrophica bacterium]|jgi:hypothetical protein|nr:LAGLIDADG family homing endonuclease [Candidatus Omnitrophota bacterium]